MQKKRRRKGVDMEQRWGRDRVRGEPYGDILHERHWSPRIWRTRGGIPREVAMGVGMVMTGIRLAGALPLVIVEVMYVCGLVVIVEVGWTGMGEEHTMPLSARTVVNDHMHSSPEKGDDQTKTHKAHNDKAYLCDALHVKKIRGYSCLDRHLCCRYYRKMGHHLLVQPGCQGPKIGDRGGVDAQGHAELPAIALPHPALPLVVSDRR